MWRFSNNMRALIGKKIGMSHTFSESGQLIPITALKVLPNVILVRKTKSNHGYDAVLLAAFPKSSKKIKKPILGQFPNKEEGYSFLAEFRDFSVEKDVGEKLDLTIFQDISFVDVKGISKGKGFQGVMRRHGFHGGRKTHGSKFHRAAGSTGMAATPSRVFKGTKMPGHMGNAETTVQNLKVVKIDLDHHILYVKGAVPGSNGTKLYIKQARKKKII